MTVFFHYALHGFANVYLVGNDETGEALIVDPAAFTLGLLDFIEGKSYSVKAVLVTHNHAHHVDGLKTLLKIYDAEVYSSNSMLGDLPCRMVRDGDRLDICGLEVGAVSVPGHSADSIAYRIGKLIFTGDALHAGLIGKTLSQYGNRLLREQLSKKILNQADDCIVLPGHGPPSTVGAEKIYNIAWHRAPGSESHRELSPQDCFDF